MIPAARRIAFRSQRKPNSSSKVPMPSWTIASGMRASAGPRAMTRMANVRSAKPAPASAGRQPRMAPTASTTVRASTNSTREARNAASTDGPACAQSIITSVPSSRLAVLAVLQDPHLFQGDQAAAHHAVEDRQERVDFLLAVDDLDDDRQILRQAQDF